MHILERPISEINFAELDPVEELRKIDPSYMGMFDVAKGRDKVIVLRSWSGFISPTVEAFLQMAIDRYETVKISNTEESRVRRELAEMAQKGIEIDNPQMEAEWEAKLEAARQKDRERIEAEKERRAKQFGIEKSQLDSVPSDKVITPGEDSLLQINGLGTKSIQKLNEAGIKNASEFMALSYEQKQQLIGPVVAQRFKS